ncbi:MAG: hypothetical protein GYA51_08370 [Candidatus Methanofastidiosa archaeon]|nr:hypothetical protein [Candidatus Methanofastidiosa archaeon]
MAATTENSEREYNRRDFLKFVNAGVILAMLTSCKSEKSIDPLETIGTITARPTATLEKNDPDLPLFEEVKVTETPVPTETPAPAYPLVPNIENFYDCYVPVEELLDGSYWNWLNEVIAPTLLERFKAKEDSIKYIKPHVVGVPNGSAFIYGHPGKPAYEDPETRPWERNVTFASTSIEQADGTTINYIVLPVFYYDKETQRIYPVVSVVPIRQPQVIPMIEKVYLETMNIPAIIYSSSFGNFEKDNITMDDLIVSQSYDKINQDDLWDMIQRFREGDVSALSSPDLVILATMSETEAYW